MGRILVGGIVGGIVMFVWGAISHMVLPTGSMGLKSLPNEDAVISALRTSVREDGIYFIPGMDMSRKLTAEEQQAWEAKLKAGPTGLLVYHQGGSESLSPRQLLLELLSDIIAALIMASILVRIGGSRVLVGALFGLFAWFSISFSYWNWYQFPGAFVGTEAIDQIVGWLLGGLAIAKIVKPATPA